jgi:pimeloyl-ACP methyl ester carboxylesterase
VPADGKKGRVEDQTIGLAGGRTVGFADYGIPDARAVLWCHGGPGSRLEPACLRREAGEAGLRIIGIDRPGYGLSAPQPGRTIAGWVPEALAVAGHLGIGQFAAVGTSTGGAFALALAALAPQRVPGVVACCSMTDIRWPEGRATMSWPPRSRGAGGARPRGGPGCGGRCARRGWQQDARRYRSSARSAGPGAVR